MIGDVLTIIWKEWKEILLIQGGSLRGGKLRLLMFVGIFGVFLPLQFGRSLIASPLALAFWAWVPIMIILNVVADSFAGERERHTLETLLASRLSDQAILLGKVGAAVGYGWGLTLFSMLLGLVTVNLAEASGELLLYPPVVGMGIVGISFLVAWLAAGTGVLVSLRAATVREAQQTLSISFMVLAFGTALATQALPAEWRAYLTELVLAGGLTRTVLVGAAVLTVMDLGLLAVAAARFRRSRLILD